MSAGFEPAWEDTNCFPFLRESNFCRETETDPGERTIPTKEILLLKHIIVNLSLPTTMNDTGKTML